MNWVPLYCIYAGYIPARHQSLSNPIAEVSPMCDKNVVLTGRFCLFMVFDYAPHFAMSLIN